jgi:hypothetical protein
MQRGRSLAGTQTPRALGGVSARAGVRTGRRAMLDKEGSGLTWEAAAQKTSGAAAPTVGGRLGCVKRVLAGPACRASCAATRSRAWAWSAAPRPVPDLSPPRPPAVRAGPPPGYGLVGPREGCSAGAREGRRKPKLGSAAGVPDGRRCPEVLGSDRRAPSGAVGSEAQAARPTAVVSARAASGARRAARVANWRNMERLPAERGWAAGGSGGASQRLYPVARRAAPDRLTRAGVGDGSPPPGRARHASAAPACDAGRAAPGAGRTSPPPDRATRDA